MAHNTRRIIQITVLQALIWHALRRTDQALESLDKVLTLAEPGEFIRTFLDLGLPMAKLLQQFNLFFNCSRNRVLEFMFGYI